MHFLIHDSLKNFVFENKGLTGNKLSLKIIQN